MASHVLATDEDPPPGTAGEDAEPEMDAEGNPVERPAPVDYKGIAKRLAMATTAADGEDEVDHLKLVCDACDDIRALDIVAKDGYDEMASKIKHFRVVDHEPHLPADGAPVRTAIPLRAPSFLGNGQVDRNGWSGRFRLRLRKWVFFSCLRTL